MENTTKKIKGFIQLTRIKFGDEEYPYININSIKMFDDNFILFDHPFKNGSIRIQVNELASEIRDKIIEAQ